MFMKMIASGVAVLGLSAGVAYAATQSASSDGHQQVFARPGSGSAQVAYPGNGKIHLIDADGSDRRVLVDGGSRFRVDHWGGIAWSRDASHIAFTVGNHRARDDLYGSTLQLYVAAGNGADARPLPGAPRGAFAPSWSPDGSQLAFVVRREDETTLGVIGIDGQGYRKLVSSTARRDFYWAPDWSPDGAWILFENNRRWEIPTKLMAVRPDGTGLHRVATIDTDTHCICADWSPDGKRIAYQAPGTPAEGTPPRYDYPEIWVMNADATGRVQITRNRPRDENPDWSPDGKRIAFYSERPGESNAEIYLIPARGGQARRVTHDPWYNGPPRWRPSTG